MILILILILLKLEQIRARITQKANLYSNTADSRDAVDLESEIYNTASAPSTFKYSKVYSMGYYIFTDVFPFFMKQ